MIKLTGVDSDNIESPIWFNPTLISRVDKLSKNTGDKFEDSWRANTRVVVLEKEAFFVKETVEEILLKIDNTLMQWARNR